MTVHEFRVTIEHGRPEDAESICEDIDRLVDEIYGDPSKRSVVWVQSTLDNGMVVFSGGRIGCPPNPANLDY